MENRIKIGKNPKIIKELCNYVINQLNRMVGGEINFKPYFNDERGEASIEYRGKIYLFKIKEDNGKYFVINVYSNNGYCFEGKIEREKTNKEINKVSRYISKLEMKIEDNDILVLSKLKKNVINEREKIKMFHELLYNVIKPTIILSEKLTKKK